VGGGALGERRARRVAGRRGERDHADPARPRAHGLHEACCLMPGAAAECLGTPAVSTVAIVAPKLLATPPQLLLVYLPEAFCLVSAITGSQR
jgi:hypothetical protein